MTVRWCFKEWTHHAICYLSRGHRSIMNNQYLAVACTASPEFVSAFEYQVNHYRVEQHTAVVYFRNLLPEVTMRCGSRIVLLSPHARSSTPTFYRRLRPDYPNSTCIVAMRAWWRFDECTCVSSETELFFFTAFLYIRRPLETRNTVTTIARSADDCAGYAKSIAVGGEKCRDPTRSE